MSTAEIILPEIPPAGEPIPIAVRKTAHRLRASVSPTDAELEWLDAYAARASSARPAAGGAVQWEETIQQRRYAALEVERAPDLFKAVAPLLEGSRLDGILRLVLDSVRESRAAELRLRQGYELLYQSHARHAGHLQERLEAAHAEQAAAAQLWRDLVLSQVRERQLRDQVAGLRESSEGGSLGALLGPETLRSVVGGVAGLVVTKLQRAGLVPTDDELRATEEADAEEAGAEEAGAEGVA